MKRNVPRIMLAAPGSGAGKTTITCGLLQALMNRGISCQAWKCGPDYIDPMFHRYVLGIPGGNLDSFFLEEEQVRRLLVRETKEDSLAVLEGVMGYFDGVAGISTLASSYDIARITETPVILVVDCKGASLSIAAMVKGFLEYGTDNTGSNGIQGILLNRISSMMAQRLIPEIEKLGVPVVGFLPVMKEMELASRHLGLVMPGEISQLRRQIEDLGRKLEETVDVDRILEIAGSAPRMEAESMGAVGGQRGAEEAVIIAVAKDKAFCFYYQENLHLLEELGARLEFFSPLEDAALPKGARGLILGGGYPELHADRLSGNEPMRAAIARAVKAGIPLLAECGGFLYLHEQLESTDGTLYPMAGVIKGQAFRTEKLSRFGYVTLQPTGIKGHEFHYWDSTDCGRDWVAEKPLSNRTWTCMHVNGNQVAGFPHLYYRSNETFIKEWLNACRTGEERFN